MKDKTEFPLPLRAEKSLLKERGKIGRKEKKNLLNLILTI